MDELVDIINQLQDVFLVSGSAGIHLPQIVVVGAQSSGKSSVLEHIVGRSFLPRGVGIVTRCPLILQLVHTPDENEEYGVFQQDLTEKFTDFNLITKQIELETDKLAGANKGICQSPISLKLFSSSFINLTLVDLPGLTKVPVGDQPSNIEDQTKDLIVKYITNPNSIILAVTPANVDMATSESLKMAKEVDPEGTRTLAVITKLDLMDQGTDAWDMLSGKVIPVKRGIVGVVNRSQKDIQDEKSILQSLKDEEEFFNNHYKSIASTNGCAYLKKKVQAILITHIKQCMPALKKEIKEGLLTKKQDLELIKDSEFDKPTQLLELITNFSNSFISAIMGKLTDNGTKEVNGGARIKTVFQEDLAEALTEIDALAGLSEPDIMNAIKNSSGVKSALFVPEVAFESLVKMQIQRLRRPALDCVKLVHEELNEIIELCIEDVELGLGVFPKLQRELEKVVTDLVHSQVPKTNDMVNSFINVQVAYINTVHPDFLPNVICSNTQKMVEFCAPTSIKTHREYYMITKLIRSYFNIVQLIIHDTVPKMVMHCLVNYVKDHLQMILMKWVCTSDAENLLQESSEITQRRKELIQDIEKLERANEIINNVSFKVRLHCNQ